MFCGVSKCHSNEKKTDSLQYQHQLQFTLCSFTSITNDFKAVYGLFFPALPAESSRKIMQITSVTNHIWSFSQARTSITISSHQSVAERSGILPSCAGDIICSQRLRVFNNKLEPEKNGQCVKNLKWQKENIFVFKKATGVQVNVIIGTLHIMLNDSSCYIVYEWMECLHQFEHSGILGPVC